MLCNGSSLFGSHSVSAHCHGLPNPLQDCPHLPQLLQVIQRQPPLPQPDLGYQGIMMEFLHRARPLHHLHLPRDSVLWAASPYYGTLWPVLQWTVITTQASGGQGSLVHPCAGCHSALLQGMLTLHLCLAFQQQDRPLSPVLPHHHELHWHSNVWSLQAWHILQQHH